MSSCLNERPRPSAPDFTHSFLDQVYLNTIAAHMHLIEGYVAPVFGILPSEINRRGRGRAHVAEARHVAMYLAHTQLHISSFDIARCYARDRSTVSYACRAVEDRRDDADFDRVLSRLEAQVSQCKLPSLCHGEELVQ